MAAPVLAVFLEHEASLLLTCLSTKGKASLSSQGLNDGKQTLFAKE